MHGKPKPASMYARFHSALMDAKRHLSRGGLCNGARRPPNWMECHSMGEGLWMHIDKCLKQEVKGNDRQYEA